MGAPTDGRVIAVPSKMQSLVKVVVRGVDGINSNTGALAFGLPASSMANLSIDWLGNTGSFPGGLQFGTLYDQYRITSVRLRYTPKDRYSKVTSSTGAFVIGVDPDGTSGVLGNVTSYPIAAAYPASIVCSTDDPFEVTFKMPEQSPGIMYDVATIFGGSPAVGVFGPQPGNLFVWGDPNTITAGLFYGSLNVELAVVLRGRIL